MLLVNPSQLKKKSKRKESFPSEPSCLCATGRHPAGVGWNAADSAEAPKLIVFLARSPSQLLRRMLCTSVR